MRFRRPFFFLLAAGVVCAAVLSSCSGGRLGYGVVLWSGEKSPVKTGQVVTVKSKSTINNTYTINLSGSRAPIDLTMWRVKLFSSEKKAVNYSLSYTPMVPLFAKIVVNGASIRDKPDTTATRVYRMREGQVVKVIGKESNRVTIGGVNGYWYQILTSDGVLGYSFGPNLQVYNPTVQTQQQASVGQLLLQKVLATTYRPQYFQQMIDNNRIDLKRFSPQFGFFVDTSAKTVKIVMPHYHLKFNYTSIQELTQNDYQFKGTPVEMIIQSPDKVQLLYSDTKRNQYDQVFVKVSKNIGYLVEKEKNRQLQVFAQFLDKTPFSSDYYGKIGLESDTSFTWTGYSRLVPDIIPPGAGNTGVVSFPLFLSNALQGQYDGAITFEFGASPKPAAVPSLTQGGQVGNAQLPILPSVTTSGNSTPAPTAPTAATSPTPPTQATQAATPPTAAAQPAAAQGSPTSPAGNPPGETTTVSFLYSFANGGVRLTYVSPSTINNDTVTSVSSTPIIIFFSYKSPGG